MKLFEMTAGTRKILLVLPIAGWFFALPAQSGELSGQQLYQNSCAFCHGSDGAGVMPGVEPLNGANGPLAKSDEIIAQTIIEGVTRPGKAAQMPPKGGNAGLTDAQIREIVEFMKREFVK